MTGAENLLEVVKLKGRPESTASWFKCQLHLLIDEPLEPSYDCSELYSPSLEVRIWPMPLPSARSKEIIMNGAGYSPELHEESEHWR